MSGYDVVTEGAANGARHDAAPGSALARARAAAARQREAQTHDLTVGGAFGEHLVIRYGTLPTGELERYAELAESITNLSLALDMMVSACRTVLWREGDELTDLDVRLDWHLWQLLDWPLPAGVDDVQDVTTRELVDTLFGRNALALGTHLGALTTWMQDPGGDEPGEASGATS